MIIDDVRLTNRMILMMMRQSNTEKMMIALHVEDEA